jgi:hypothetical protein
MTTDARRWLGGLVLALGCFLLVLERPLAADNKAPAVPLSDADFDRLVDQCGKTITDALKGKPDDSGTDKARTSAMVLAALARYSEAPNNSSRRAAVREVALKVAGALKENDIDLARKHAGSLAKPPEAPKTSASGPMIGKQITFKEIMHHYSGRSVGGTGGEKKIGDLADNKDLRKAQKLPDKELNDELILLALRSAAVGELIKEHTDAKVKKAPAAWKDYAEEMRKYSLELAKAAKGKDGAAAWKAVDKLNGSCDGCHQKFERYK